MDTHNIGLMIGAYSTMNLDVVRGIMSKNHPIYTEKPECMMSKEERKDYYKKIDDFYKRKIDDSYEKHPDWWEKWWQENYK